VRTLPPIALALMLAACSRSRAPEPPRPLPPPPAASLIRCRLPDLPLRAMSSADVEQVLRDDGTALADCESKRAALVAGWPD